VPSCARARLTASNQARSTGIAWFFRTLLSTIRGAGEHLPTVINDILDLSKIEAGRMQIECLETDLPRLLFDVDSLMRSRGAQKGVQLQTRLRTPIPERVLSDPTRLRQNLINLVGNATKFTARGQIEAQVDVSTLAAGPALHIAVVDTGGGMSQVLAAKLFQPFVQADSSVTRKNGGTGLGLTICRRLAHLMGGEVELYRTVLGEGSTFTVSLPPQIVAGTRHVEDLRTCVPAQSTGEASATNAIALQGRILLAEDGEDNQRLISHHLRKAGAEVVIAEHGRRALEVLAAADLAGQPFGLLVSDIQMPEMDGYTLARTLRARGNTLPIIALTAHAMEDDRQKCLDAGCSDYASKPINRDTLIASCARWLRPPSNAVSAPESTEIFPTFALHRDLLGDSDYTELVDTFIVGLSKRIERIEHSFRRGAWPDLMRLAHQLKGAAGGYGYPSITAAARQLEHSARDRITAETTTDPNADLSRAVANLLDQCHLAIRIRERALCVEATAAL
jgi:CheY-like chemotaxis protein/HPt (histidine-containing phosphotransfer) domain-containing protein